MDSTSVKVSKVDYLLGVAVIGDLDELKVWGKALDNGYGISEALGKIRASNGTGLLHAAASAGNTNICNYLIEELKFNVDDKDNKGYTPLLLSSMKGKSQTMAYLIEKNADPAASCARNATSLHYSAVLGNVGMISLLVSKGFDVNGPSIYGTPLEMAASSYKHEAIKVLLDHGANPNLCSGISATALGFSLYSSSLECAELLLKAGADPNGITCGKTPLGFAAMQRKIKFIKLLLKFEADPNIVDLVGLLPIELAAINGNDAEIKALFPVTAPIPACSDWSIKGILKYVNSKNVVKQREIRRKELNNIARSKGDNALERGEHERADLFYTEALASDHSDAISVSKKSLCAACRGDGNAALKAAEVCMSLKPNWSEGYYRAGVAFSLLKEFDKAAGVFLSGLKLDPDNKDLREGFRKAVEDKFNSLHV